ncbi:MAG TPA: glycosyltransferase family 4 protein [Candidatus Acidoferrum sp.]
MPERRYRILVVPTHPVQYASANFREMARHPRLDVQVAYCSLSGAEPAHDPEFGTVVQWDVPLLDGYPWIEVPNRGNGSESFWGLRNPDLWRLIRSGNFDALLCLTSYRRASFWICFFAARSRGIPFLFGTDAASFEPREPSALKRFLKRLVWPRIFRLADQVIVVSTPGREMMQSLGIPSERIALLPNVVDNQWWRSASDNVDRAAIRASWNIGVDAHVIAFCAKLQEWKRPAHLLRAFAQAQVRNSFLVIAGEGPLKANLEAEAKQLDVSDRVRFLGFVNQSHLPAVYTASDLMVLPSEYEPFAMVVNEAMLCGCPVVVSDHVGSARDLVAPVAPDFIYPYGNVAALASTLQHAFADPARLQSLRAAARSRMQTWSPKDNVSAMVNAIDRAHALRQDPHANPIERSAANKTQPASSRPAPK